MPYWLTLLVLSAVTYRVGRFIVLDSLVEGTRDKVIEWLEMRQRRLVWRKLKDLLGCPYCVTIWISAGACLVHHHVVDPLPAPVWTWLAVAAGAVMIWSFVDSDER